jgi:2-desacetyl-2-hydroxyethyl bacteriochlorophyllide A dehydrogenase
MMNISKTMQAVIWTRYGPPEVLQVKEIETPTPGPGQILVKVKAASVSAGDCEMRELQVAPYLNLALRGFFGFFRPSRIQILGQELAGEVVQIGPDVKNWQVGDRVFGTAGLKMGGYAQYILIEDVPDEMDGAIARIPPSLSFQQAAALPLGGMEALHFLRLADIQVGEKVLVIGGGGSIGTYGIQLAKNFGAEVTGVDRSDKFDLMSSLGADQTIDYTREDYSAKLGIYDAILDVVGKDRISRYLPYLKPGGHYLIVNPRLTDFFNKNRISRKMGKILIIGASNPNTQDLTHLAQLVESGQLTPVLDQQFELDDAVQAHHYAESGAKRGNLILNIPPPDSESH